MRNKKIIDKIFTRAENPVAEVEALANLCPFILERPEDRVSFNNALRPYGYKVNDEVFKETDQIVMMSHSSCGSSSSYGGHSSCGSSNSWGGGSGHSSCGSSNGWGRGSSHSSCCASTDKPYAKIILPIRNDIGNQNGIRN